MVSVASGGTVDRIAARILFKVLRAGSGTPARYSSTFFGAPLPFAAELRLPDFTFFMRAMLQKAPVQVYASARRATARHQKCDSVYRHARTRACLGHVGEVPHRRRRSVASFSHPSSISSGAPTSKYPCS